MTGYAAIFYGTGEPLTGRILRTDADATIKGNGIGDVAGFYATAGDLNGDGVTDFVLTAMCEDNVPTCAGALSNFPDGRSSLYVFYGTAGTQLQGHHLINPLTMSHGNVRIASEHPGDSAGWWIEANGDVTGDGVDDLVVGAPSGCDDADFQEGACTKTPGATYVVAGCCPPPREVDIDIKPGSDENAINPGSSGSIPVAVITTDAFDARNVDIATVTFGPGAARVIRSAIEDVDRDGDDDLMLHFRARETGLAAGNAEACLTGATTTGIAIRGCDRANVT